MQFTYSRPKMTGYQLAALFTAHRIAVVLASTKAGKTAGCMVWLTEQAMQGKTGQNFWWVAPIRDQAKIVFRRLKRALDPRTYTANETELTITLKNGAVIWFKGADHPDSLYGDDVYAAVIDEASRLKEDSWYAVRSTLTATRGKLRIIGNVKGRKNWAYQLAMKAQAGDDPDLHYAKITAHDAVEAGILSADEIARAQRDLPEQVFRELYLAEPSDDGGNPFGLAAIAACVLEGITSGNSWSSGAPVAFWGIDLAKSIDWTVLIGLDLQGRVCRIERFQKSWEDTIGDIIRIVGKTPCLIDSTGVGDPIVELVQKGLRQQGGKTEGFKFTSATKQQLMEGLAVAIQQKQIAFPSGVLRTELESFEYSYTRTGVTYSAPDGSHDDCVCALALAVACRTAAGRIEPFDHRRFAQVDL